MIQVESPEPDSAFASVPCKAIGLWPPPSEWARLRRSESNDLNAKWRRDDRVGGEDWSPDGFERLRGHAAVPLQ